MAQRLEYCEWTIAPSIKIRTQAGGGGIQIEGVPKTLKNEAALELAAAIQEAADFSGGHGPALSPKNNVADLAAMVQTRPRETAPSVETTSDERENVAALGNLVQQTEQSA